MRAEVISLGLEAEAGRAWAGLAGVLAELGVELGSVTLVAADEPEAGQAMRQAVDRSNLVIIEGASSAGEDAAKKAVSKVLGKRLILQGKLLDRLKEEYRARDLDAPQGFEKTALLPAGAKWFEAVEASPGFYLEHKGRYVLYTPCIPDDPRKALPDELARLLTRGRLSRRFEMHRVIRSYGMEEARARELTKDLLVEGVSLGFVSSFEGVDIRVKAVSDGYEKAGSVLAGACAGVMERLGDYCYGAGPEKMEEAVARLLIEKKLTVALAESCTGGLLTKRLTDVSGSSAYMERAAVTYSNRAKEEMLDVSPRTLMEHGAVSRETAEEMAQGVRWKAKTDVGLSVTGIAGPTGGTLAKPVGLVYIGLATPDGVTVKGFNFPGDRESVRFASSQKALDMVRRYLIS